MIASASAILYGQQRAGTARHLRGAPSKSGPERLGVAFGDALQDIDRRRPETFCSEHQTPVANRVDVDDAGLFSPYAFSNSPS